MLLLLSSGGFAQDFNYLESVKLKDTLSVGFNCDGVTSSDHNSSLSVSCEELREDYRKADSLPQMGVTLWVDTIGGILSNVAISVKVADTCMTFTPAICYMIDHFEVSILDTDQGLIGISYLDYSSGSGGSTEISTLEIWQIIGFPRRIAMVITEIYESGHGYIGKGDTTAYFMEEFMRKPVMKGGKLLISDAIYTSSQGFSPGRRQSKEKSVEGGRYEFKEGYFIRIK